MYYVELPKPLSKREQTWRKEQVRNLRKGGISAPCHGEKVPIVETATNLLQKRRDPLNDEFVLVRVLEAKR
jgi:hypothetical protein